MAWRGAYPGERRLSKLAPGLNEMMSEETLCKVDLSLSTLCVLMMMTNIVAEYVHWIVSPR